MLVVHETFNKLLTNMLTVKLIIITITIIIIIISTTATLGTEESGCCREVTIKGGLTVNNIIMEKVLIFLGHQQNFVVQPFIRNILHSGHLYY